MKFLETAICGALTIAAFASAVPTYERRHPRANPKPEQFRELLTKTYNKRHPNGLDHTGGSWNGTHTAPAHKPGSTGIGGHHNKPHAGKQSKPGKKPFGFHPHPGHAPVEDGSKEKPGKGDGGHGGSDPGKGHGGGGSPGKPETCTSCPGPASNEINAPYENIWLGLSHDEAADVTKFLFENESLNLTVAENATEWDNTV